MTPLPRARPLPASAPVLLREIADGLAILTLNRPEMRNSLSEALLAALGDALTDIGADRSVRAVVIAANGPAFSAGHDLKELRSQPKREIYQAVFQRCSQLMQAIVALKTS